MSGVHEAGFEVVQGKVSPPIVSESAVRRPRVESLLAELVEANPLVCVYATAGAGKTTAVMQTAIRTERALAWLTVADTEGAPGRLLTYLEAAIARQIPTVRGLVHRSLRVQLPAPDVAALLAEAIGDVPILLVVDDVERLATKPEAIAVLDALARYAPSCARVVLISRRELPLSGTKKGSVPWIVTVGDNDLAFTVDEAAAALERIGRTEVDAAAAAKTTGGWVTGVLFEAWRSSQHVSGLGGEADPLHGYLAVQILAELDPDQRRFLVVTSLLDEVTAEAAEALGLMGAGERLDALQARHLPVTWSSDGTRLRCHPRFREYLRKRLGRWPVEDLRELRRAHAQWLIQCDRYEDAVEQLLQNGAVEDAVEIADWCLAGVVERTDFAVAERWLAQLVPARQPHHTGLAGAELMLAIAREDYRRGVAVADQLAADGQRDAVASSSSALAGMMGWCYLHSGRLSEIRTVLDVGQPGAELDALRYCIDSIIEPAKGAAEPVPSMSNMSRGPLDALIMRVNYHRGLLSLLLERPVSAWAARASESWQLAALLAMGHVDKAAEFYRTICETRDPGLWLSSNFRVQLLSAQGDRDGAWQALVEGRSRARSSGSVMLEVLSYVDEAELRLRFDCDTRNARAALDRVRSHEVGRRYTYISEQSDTWLGLALLRDNQAGAAAECLRPAVESMYSDERLLALPAAAVYLAEAEWRLGDQKGADKAADIAVSAAARQGSNHLLLNALADFPSVCARRMDAERASESPWHDLSRALVNRDDHISIGGPVQVQLTEFGRIAIFLRGVEVHPRIKKSGELLAFLATRSDRQASKYETLKALFDGRSGDAAASYLRQAVLRLREVLGDETVHVADGHVSLSASTTLRSEAEQFDRLTAEAARLRGKDRLTALLEALAIVAGGEYLPGISSAWVEERRQKIELAAIDARSQGAEQAFALGDVRCASELIEIVLKQDPYRESAWRLAMRLAEAAGDLDRVISTYRRCVAALEELGTMPTATTRQLLEDLRH